LLESIITTNAHQGHSLISSKFSLVQNVATSYPYCGTDDSEPVASAMVVILVHKQTFSSASQVMQH